MMSNYNGSNFSIVCSMLRDGLQDGILSLQQTALVYISPFAVILNSAVIYYLIMNKLFNKNFKLLLGSLSFFNIIFTCSVLINGVRLLTFYSHNPCDLIMTFYLCSKINSLVVATVIVIPFTLLALSIERLCASILYRQYDDMKSAALPATLLAFVLIMTLVVVLPAFIQDPLPDELALRSCDSIIIKNYGSSLYKVLLIVSAESISMFIFIYIHFSDRKKYHIFTINQAANRLKIRYQLTFNIQVNKALLPSTLVGVPCYTIGNLFMFASSTAMYKEQKVYSNFVIILATIFSILQPMILFWCNKWFKEPLSKDMNRIFKFLVQSRMKNKVGGAERGAAINIDNKKADQTTVKYFDDLDKMWN
uniref:G-protein coupled receptors family 1 profile domain-containing protein n=1 Tax=Romanomermis culicivorax TaxID=13658 RepID=A0A915HW88_ROMCU